MTHFSDGQVLKLLTGFIGICAIIHRTSLSSHMGITEGTRVEPKNKQTYACLFVLDCQQATDLVFHSVELHMKTSLYLAKISFKL